MRSGQPPAATSVADAGRTDLGRRFPTGAADRPWHERLLGGPRQAFRATLIVLVTAAVWGGLTPFGQQYLPDELRSLANAAGPWFAVVTAAIVVARPAIGLAIILGVLGLIVMNESYGVVSRWRGFPYGSGLGSIWNIIALGVGPAAGIAATWLRSSRPILIALGASAPAAVLIGEGLFGLTIVKETTSPVFWSIELGAGIAVIVVAVVTSVRTLPGIGVLVGASALGAGLFYLAYSSL